MKEGFLSRFIENEYYLQNIPLNVEQFIQYCGKRGIATTEKELEFFEREGLFNPIIRIVRPIGKKEIIIFTKDDGNRYSRPLEDGLRTGEKEIGTDKQYYYSSYRFSSVYKDLLLGWIEKEVMYDPSLKPFQPWSSFVGEKLMFDDKKIVSLYSSYQIYWLYILKKCHSIKINLAGDTISIFSAVSDPHWFLSETGACELGKIEDIYPEMKKLGKDEVLKYYFNAECKKEKLKTDYKSFELVLEFLISIQNVYTPYGRSGAKEIQITDTFPRSTEWEEKRKTFNPYEPLTILNLDIKHVVWWYMHFSRKAIELLGGKRNDLAQLWKNIRWSIKDDIEGNFRLGVEFLQWALMLKAFIEAYLGRKIFDIDEVINCTVDSVLECNISAAEGCFNLRGVRNRDYSDENKNYWDDEYRKLFYLANHFGLDYQPRIMVFVEGKTEETIFPRIFEWYYDKPENHGIEIISFEGVDKLLSTSKTADQLRNLVNLIQRDIKSRAISSAQRSKLNELINKLNDVDIIISNWTSFISYNLEKWQIIPFFISDREGNIKHFLEAEKPIRFNNNNFNVPNRWRYLWGVDNANRPFSGYNFELANFDNMEIASAITEVIGHTINTDAIEALRERESGINKLDERIDAPQNKIKIANALFDNLIEKYNESKDNSIFERPIFLAIKNVIEIAALNHLPMNRRIEIKNKEIIESILKNNSSD